MDKQKRRPLFLAVLSIAFALGILASCANTPPIEDSKGNLIPGSIASLEKIEIGGQDQWIMIRGNSADYPVLLWLHGGPGAAQMPVARHFNGQLEEHFVVVHWDQRGAGKSNPRSFDEGSMSISRFLSDAHQLTGYLKQRFGREQIYLLGHSWGAQLGLMLADAYPRDYYAYVAVGQLVDSLLAHKIAHRWLSERIAAAGNRRDSRRLEELGPAPFPDHEDYVDFVHLVDEYGGSFDVPFSELVRIAVRQPEYRLPDYFRWLRGANRGSGPMWESTLKFNAFRDVPRLEVPVYFFSGVRDYNTPLQLVQRYFSALDAPEGKKLVKFHDSAHTPCFAEPEHFNREVARVKAETYDAR